jgi:23S rRNA U2552 (ribose-2'-O)-methylase RlmE/FtsJ
MKFNTENLKKWFEDDGDRTHILNYKLDNDSVVIDLGAYKGVWVEMLLEKIYPVKPKIILVPVKPISIPTASFPKIVII